MKKTFYAIVAMFTFTVSAFANNEVKISNLKEGDKTLGQICCRRGVSNSNGENVTVRACVETTGDAQIDMGSACAKALKAAKEAITLVK